MSDLLARGDKLVAKATAAGADHAEIYLGRGASVSLEIEQGRVTGGARNESAGGAVRLLVDGRLGFAYFSRDSQAEEAIQRALATSRLAPRLAMQFPEPKPAPTLDRWDDQVARLESEDLLSLGRAIIQGVEGADVALSAGVSLEWGKAAIVNSNGVAFEDRSTAIDGYASVVQDGEPPINAWDTVSTHGGEPDLAELSRNVVATAESLQTPQPAKSHTADLLLRPGAASELLGLVVRAADGDDHYQGKTFWSDRLGEAVGHQGISIVDDPLDPMGIGSTPFDGEGTVARRNPIVEQGRFVGLLFDHRDAARHGAETSASCVRGGFASPPGSGAHHVSVQHKHNRPEEALIAEVDDGFLVDSVLGAHTANATTGEFSVTATNVWRIQNGEIIGASQEVALAGSIQSWLERLDGISDSPKRMSGMTVGSLRIRDVDVSA